MEAFVMEFGSALLRWAHVITGIAWIGASFYFMHLDASLKPVADIPAGKGGAVWEVHGGGFYEVKKYLEVPAHLPAEMIWHKWQSYSTWITGFFLLVWIYYAQSELYLVDPAVMALTPLTASAIGLAGLAVSWLVYDGLCRSPLARNEVALATVGFLYVVALAWGFQQVFSGRGALIHVGAAMATLMSANVFFIIIPGQKKIIAALTSGQRPDPELGKRAKIRSTHNNYLTLPVLFLMLANHYPLFSATPYGYVIVGMVLIAGALIRHFYNVSHSGKGEPWWCWIGAGLAMLAAFWIAATASPAAREMFGMRALPGTETVARSPIVPKEVSEVILGRCSMCHAREPTYSGIVYAPKGVFLDTPEEIARQKEAIRMHSVFTRSMPPNNISEMTAEERRLLAAWTGKR